MARAEQMADRLEQARQEGVVVVYAAADLEVVKPVLDDFEHLETTGEPVLHSPAIGGHERSAGHVGRHHDDP